ncbi:MAG: hypothetical protein HYU51_00645 [Candidatus Rokubacteria bacterium]|nr:hypothetical protein [Candidatus Rokubacteria bacterium]
MKARRTGVKPHTSTGKGRKAKAPARRRRRAAGPDDISFVESLDERLEHRETSPALSGGDVDADWQGANSTGEEAVGGSSATPDQDVVDEIGRALGVEQDTDEEVHTSAEILRARDRDYWRLEREAAEDDRS